MYEYSPTPNRKAGTAVAVICFFAGIMLFMPLAENQFVEMLFRSVGLWLFLCGFLVTERYIFTNYIYALEYNGNDCDFVVTETRLKKQRTVCRISSIQFRRLYKIEKKKPLPCLEKKTKKYNYFPDLWSGRLYLLLVDDNGPAAIRFCPDEKMAEIIKTLICTE